MIYVALPALRFIKKVWPFFMALWHIAHFFSGGVFLPRGPIHRNRMVTKTWRVSLDSNILNLPFDDVVGVPENQSMSTRSRTSSTSGSETDSWTNGERQDSRQAMGVPPYLNLAITSSEEGLSYLYHG